MISALIITSLSVTLPQLNKTKFKFEFLKSDVECTK